MKKNSFSGIFWGLIFIGIAVYIILDVMELTAGIGIWSALLAVLALVILIKSIKPLNFFGIFFPIALGGILFDSVLGIEAFTPWPILGIALFLSIGFSVLFRKSFKSRAHMHGRGRGCGNVNFSQGVHVENDDRTYNEEQTADGSIWNIEGGLGKKITYITSQNLETVNLEFGLGELQVYFTDSKMLGDSITVNAEVGMGRAILYFPKEWNVEIVSKEVFGNVTEQAHIAPEGAPIVYMNMDVGMGQVEINYI